MTRGPSYLNRRQFMKVNAAAAAGVMLAPRSARAAHATSPREQAAGFYRFAMGEMTVTVLCDGAFLVPRDIAPMEMGPAEIMAPNVEPDERQAYFRHRLVAEDQFPIPALPVMIDTGRERVLIDTGWAQPNAPATTGKLGAALQAAEISRDSIDIIILTHAHPDHIGGLIDPETQRPTFRNARVIISAEEREMWLGDDAEQRLRDFPIPLAAIQGVLRGLGDRLQPVPAGREVARGVRTIASPGHTPGHVAVAAESGSQRLLMVGDALTNIHSSFERPQWHNFFDFDRDQAASTRRRLLEQAVADEMLILGFHFPFPGLGRALREGEAYRWYPAGWLVLP